MADELGAEPQVGDGNDDQGDEERQRLAIPVVAQDWLVKPESSWGLRRRRTVPFRTYGIGGTSRLRGCAAAANGACRCDTARAWP